MIGGSSRLRHRDGGMPTRRRSTPLGEVLRRVLAGSGAQSGREAGELDAIPVPDLLAAAPGPPPDAGRLLDQLDLAFLGRASAGELDAEIDGTPVPASAWVPAHFADDLFLAELARGVLGAAAERRGVTVHRRHLERVLTRPPHDLATVKFRQQITREMEEDGTAAEAVETLLRLLGHLTHLLRASRDDARLEPIRFRFDVLHAFREVVEQMADGFSATRSGLRRVHDHGERLRRSEPYRRMVELLDHDAAMATLTIDTVIGADGRIRHLQISGIRERSRNLFYRRPLRRWWDRLRALYHRYSLDRQDVVDRIVMEVYGEISPALARALQLAPQLELYAASRSLAAEVRARGLEVCLPRFEASAGLDLEEIGRASCRERVCHRV